MRTLLLLAAALTAAACSPPGLGSGSAGGTPLDANVPPDLLACRSRVDNEMSYSEIALRSEQNLGAGRVADRSGIERRARLHPDGNTVVFARQRESSRPESRELFTSTIDGSAMELRLTLDATLDDEPCWSPDGATILFASERGGDKALWLCDRDGTDPRPFLTPPAGFADGEPDWCRATGRVVFRRDGPTGPSALWLATGSGTGVTPFTDGGLGGAGLGDRDPAFSPDGATVAFARHSPNGAAALCLADVASGAVTIQYVTAGEIGLPRYSPRADRIFFGLSEPGEGRAPLRLAVFPFDTGIPVLVWPDERYRLEGIDVLPGIGAAPTGDPPRRLDILAAEVDVSWGSAQGFQSVSRLAEADGNELHVGTLPTSNREVAGITCTFDLPVDDPLDALELQLRAVARVDRIDGDARLRMSFHNTADGRFDTVVELPPASTGEHTLSFRTSSLRHVSRERQIRVTVIADLPRGDRSQLHVDLVEAWVTSRPATGG